MKLRGYFKTVFFVFKQNLTEVVEDFNPIDNDTWIYIRGGSVSNKCAGPLAASSSFVFTEASSQRVIKSTRIRLEPNSTLQFSMSIGCGGAYLTDTIAVEYSLDDTTWNPVQSACRLGDRGCTPYQFQSSYRYDEFPHWRRVTYFYPVALGGAVFVRWRQTGSGFSTSKIWAIDDIYMGSACPMGCYGHGQCLGGGKCRCDPGYSGPMCKTVTDSFRTTLRDTFDTSISPALWSLVVGGTISSGCGVISSGNSLYFNTQSNRQAITVDLDTTQAR